MYTLEPLFATFISALVLKEPIGVSTFLGAICILRACTSSSI